MNIWGRAGLLAVGVCLAMPAWASDKQDFEACDGRLQPGRQDDGMRGEASRQGYGFPPEFRTGSLDACGRALASPRLLPTQTLRHANLLRARAAIYLRIGDSSKALADLDLAEKVAADHAGDRFYQRSMAVSLKLLRALAYARSNNLVAAVPLAQEAVAARPYSLNVQEVGAAILQVARPIGAASPSPWAPVVALQPDAAVKALISEAEVGNFAGVLALRPGITLAWPVKPIAPLALASRAPDVSQLLAALIVSLHTAYARAATGDSVGARRDIADVRAKAAVAQTVPADGPFGEAGSSAAKAITGYIDIRARQVEARIAVTEGRPSDAIGALIAAPMPRDAATVELLGALKTKVAPKDVAMLPDVAPFNSELSQNRREELTSAVSAALIEPETPRAVVDYEQARPNILGALIGGALSMGTSLLGGISRTDGFRSTQNPDGTTKVEFIGNTPSAALVQEMTLLRAAEIARAAGKAAFIIVNRHDFSRMLTTTQYGQEISRIPTGFKTELTIRLIDAPSAAEHALDAVKIIDALGPLYYEDKVVKS
jgi:hypothetical protein